MRRIIPSLIPLIIGLLAAPLLALAQTSPDPSGRPFCEPMINVPPRPLITEKLEPGDTYIVADEADLVEGGVSHLEGNAEIAKDQQQAVADEIDYNQPQELADLQGNVNYWDNEIYLNSPTAQIDLGQSTGQFDDADYWLYESRLHGHSRELFVDKPGMVSKGKNIDFTSCDPQKSFWDLTTNIWKLTAKSLTLDHETDRGAATHVILKIKDIPVFYTPYMTFPLSDKRKSGFLVPSYGSSSRNGFEFMAPYYWNIAPEMDATFTPRLITDSGLMMMGEYRYLFNRGAGSLNVDYLPGDSQFNDQDRSAINFTHQQSFLRSGYLSLLYNRISDTQYFEDFGGSISTTSIQYIDRHAAASYSWNISKHSLRLYSILQDFQTVDPNLPVTSRPYKRLPSTYLTFASPRTRNNINYDIGSEVSYFTRGDDPLLNNVNGLRFDIYPSVSYPFENVYSYVKPKAGVRFTQYELNNNNFFEESPDRAIPIVSVDSGLFLERDVSLFGDSLVQTLEPRLYYLYVPENDQTDLPVFDAGIYDTSFASLFYENRFIGPDRVGDANQVTLAVSSHLYRQNTGQQLVYFNIGQTVYLRDREVVLPGYSPARNTLSPVIMELGTTFFNHWNIKGELQWDTEVDSARKIAFSAQYSPERGKVLNLAYRVRRQVAGIVFNNFTDLEQTDVSFRWSINPEWSVVGRWNYALEEKQSMDLFGGVEYNSCCWAFRVVGRRFLNAIDNITITNPEFQTGIFLQIELKGLAGIGQKTVDFLTETIPGFESEF